MKCIKIINAIIIKATLLPFNIYTFLLGAVFNIQSNMNIDLRLDRRKTSVRYTGQESGSITINPRK